MSRPVVLGAIAVILTGAVVVVFWPSQDSVEAAARRAADCFQRRDSNCLYEMQPSEEIDLYGLDRAAFQRILADYVWREDATFDASTLKVIKDNKSTGAATWTMRRASGREFGIGVSVAKTPDGFRAPRLLATLVLMTQIGYSDKPTGLGREKMQAWVEIGKRDKAKLESLGMKGVYRRPDVGFQTWDEWIAATEERLARPPATPKAST